MVLAEYLRSANERFDADLGLVGEVARTPGYHTTLPDGAWVHSTRTNLDYALACLADGRVERAALVIDRVLVHQETDPYLATYGIWPWFTDEPLSQMAPPDWNWADFCGARLAAALARHAALLPADLIERMRTALGHAAWSIFRRNVRPDYTNIALMGAAVTLAAGELLGEPRLVAYGRSRLAHFAQHTAWHGGLNEYNSPTYTRVALSETERVLDLVADEAARATAEALRRVIWQTIAEHYHPATGQWAGPHSRCYGDRLDRDAVEWLAACAGVAIDPPLPAERFSLDRELPCPDDLRPRFAALGSAESTVVRRFVRREPEQRSTVGTTWLAQGACLGTVNHDTLWVQRRPALGYWATDGLPAVLRVRCLRDGRDFATGALWAVQQGPQALVRLGFVPGQGDHHCSLDRPADGLFAARRLSFAVDLEADDATVEPVAGGWALSAGGWQAIVLPLPSAFGGHMLEWQAEATQGSVRCEVRLIDGAGESFGWDRLRTAAMGFALTLCPKGGVVPEAPELSVTEACWGAAGLRMDWPGWP